MRNRTFLKMSGRKGSILVVAFLLCTISGLTAIWLFNTLQDHQRVNVRRRDIKRAYFAAEAGVSQVMHWGNFPSDYDGGGTSGLFYRDLTNDTFPNLSAVLSSEYTISSDKLHTFRSTHAGHVFHVSRMKEVVLVPPDSTNDPVSCFFKVRSTGITPSGTERRVLAYLDPNPLDAPDIKLPAGLISMGTAGQSGNGTVHWGESWSKDDFDILNRPLCDHLKNGDSSYDQWAKIRTEGRILFEDNSTWGIGNGLDVYDVFNSSPSYDPGLYGDPGASGDYEGAFEINIPPDTLEWPDMPGLYAAFKSQAKAHGRYYSTDSSGNIYRDGVEDSAHLVNFDDEFGDANRDSSPYDLVFIDTTDGNPPADDGSNLSTVQNSGTGEGMKGVFYVCANIQQAGAGNPANLDAERPDGVTETLKKVYLDGVLYSAGWMDLAGNPVVFGTVISEQGFLSGGTPEVYYNYKLKDGLELPKGNVGSTFRIVLQQNY